MISDADNNNTFRAHVQESGIMERNQGAHGVYCFLCLDSPQAAGLNKQLMQAQFTLFGTYTPMRHRSNFQPRSTLTA